MTEEKKYAVLPKEFIQNISNECGIEVNDELLGTLAEDATYRMRELLDLCTHFMRHSNRSCLKTNDLNKTFYWYNLEKPWGASKDSVQNAEYTSIENTDMFVENNETVNLYECLKDEKIPTLPDNIELQKHLVRSDYPLDNFVTKVSVISQPSNDLMDYYQSAVSTTLGDNSELFNEVLKDIQSNPKITPILPYFVNFISGINAVSHDLEKLSRFLQVAKALLFNKYISCNDYLEPITSAILYCILEPLTASIYSVNDHWKVRDFGANIIGHVINLLYPQSSIREVIEISINNILNDPTRPLCSHYGAVRILLALGDEFISNMLLPNMSNYCKSILNVSDEETNLGNIGITEDAFQVSGVVVECMILTLNRAKYKTDPTQIYKCYPTIYDIFGETVSARIPLQTPSGHKTQQVVKNIRESAFKHVLFNSSSENSPKSSFHFHFPPIKKYNEKLQSKKLSTPLNNIFKDYPSKALLRSKISIAFGISKIVKQRTFQWSKNVDRSTNFDYRQMLRKCCFTGKRRNIYASHSYLSSCNVHLLLL